VAAEHAGARGLWHLQESVDLHSRGLLTTDRRWPVPASGILFSKCKFGAGFFAKLHIISRLPRPPSSGPQLFRRQHAIFPKN
jgi:hypothetical protein